MSTNWFVAIPIPPEAWFNDRLEPSIPGLWRVHPADLHMTIAYLGPVEESVAREAFALHSAWKGGIIDAQSGPIIPLGDPHRYSALVMTLKEGNEKAKSMMSTLGPLMKTAAGRPPEHREPLPHVTLVRAKRRTGKGERAEAIRWGTALDLPSCSLTLNQLALYRGRNATEGPRYEIVHQVPLGGAH
jgi:2'-5' RNA ligase